MSRKEVVVVTDTGVLSMPLTANHEGSVRAVIGQAKAILMGAQRCGADEAFGAGVAAGNGSFARSPRSS